MFKSLPSITSQIPRDLRNFIDRLRERVDGGGSNRLLSLADLTSAGLATTDAAGNIVAVTPSRGTPPAPTGLTATAAINNVIVEWNAATYGYHSHTEVWGASSNNLTAAVLLGLTPGAIYTDALGPGTTRYYWVRFVNTSNEVGPFNAINGTSATTGEDVDYLLTTLAGQITETELFTDLNTRLNKIEITESKYTVKIDNAGHISGFGLISTANNATPYAAFGIRANQFFVAPPATVQSSAPSSGLYKGYVWVDSSVTPNVTKYYTGSGWTTTPQALPFVVQATPTTEGTVSVPAGVYMDAAFIKNATITNAKIADLAVDNAKISNLSVGKLSAGSISTGEYIQSTGFLSGTQGWRINGNGAAEFGSASIRGQLTASQIDTRGLSIKDTAGNIILQAGVGVSQKITIMPVLNYDFRGYSNGFVASGATQTSYLNGLWLDSDGTDPIWQSPSFGDINNTCNNGFYGGNAPIVRVRLARQGGSGWQGTCYYATSGHGYSESYQVTVSSDPTIVGGYYTYDYVQFDFDFSNVSNWNSSYITQLRFDFGGSASDVFLIDSVTIGSYGVGNRRMTAASVSTYIADAAIGNAQIGNAAIGTAEIGDLAVSTLKIQEGAYTVMSWANSATLFTSGGFDLGLDLDTMSAVYREIKSLVITAKPTIAGVNLSTTTAYYPIYCWCDRYCYDSDGNIMSAYTKRIATLYFGQKHKSYPTLQYYSLNSAVSIIDTLSELPTTYPYILRYYWRFMIDPNNLLGGDTDQGLTTSNAYMLFSYR